MGISDLTSQTHTSISEIRNPCHYCNSGQAQSAIRNGGGFWFSFRNPQSAIRNGFTLLEVLIALAIIGLTLTVIMHSQHLSIGQGIKAKHYTTAIFLANEILSETFIQEEPLLEIESGNFTDYPEFSWERETEDSDVAGLKSIKITVSGPENTRIILNTYRLQQSIMQTGARR
jgi:prepilin-type N-terminal cleavage/methylation domain-containing protein